MLLKLYAHLLKLYPDHYQTSYKAGMIQTMEDIVANESRSRSMFILLREGIITPVNALEQYAIDFSHHRHVKPGTIVTLIAVLLLTPFFISIIIDEITEFTVGGHLYNTWFWSRPLLEVWIVFLPFICLALSLSTYVVSLCRHIQKERRVNPFAKRYWLILSTIILSAGILVLVMFHDSASCWSRQTNITNVLTCTETGFVTSDFH
jgi:ABC-type multidrug transport system permease subunit